MTTSRSTRSPRRWAFRWSSIPTARAILERYYADKGGLNEGRLRMARVPEGAELIPNRMSGAPGIRIGNLFLMAGVPHITAGMLDALTGTLEGGRPLVSVTVGAFAPESEVADMLRQAEQSAEGISIGSYPFFKEGRVGSNFVVRSEDERQREGGRRRACRKAGRSRLRAGRRRNLTVADVDPGDDRHAGPKAVRQRLIRIDPDPHRDPLGNLDEIAGGIVGPQHREFGARGRRQILDMALQPCARRARRP